MVKLPASQLARRMTRGEGFKTLNIYTNRCGERKSKAHGVRGPHSEIHMH